MKKIIIDTETTGLLDNDELLQVSILSYDGEVLFNEYIKPTRKKKWTKAQTIHGISPEMVQDCKTFRHYKKQIQEIINSADMIIGYNTYFDVGFLEAKADMDVGSIPFIGATDSNNGITAWIKTTNSSLDQNVLGVNYNGSVVENFYHEYSCVFSDDVKRLHLKHIQDNKYILLFFKTLILQQKCKYTYGYKFNGHRMERQKILVPVDERGEPDYAFMEQYGRYLMAQKYQQYLDYLSA